MASLSSLKLGVVRGFWNVNFQLRKRSPEILLGAGIIGGITTVYLASKATLMIEEIVEEVAETQEAIKVGVEKGETPSGRPYSEENGQKDMTTLYIQTGIRVAKLYAPAIGVGALSIICLLVSHGIMARRQAALIAAYNLLSESYRRYRQGIIEKYGKDVDDEIRLGIKNDDDSNWEEAYDRVREHLETDHSRIFDKLSYQWEPDPLLNKAFLETRQSHFNQMLNIRGHVFLNEIYDELGLPRSRAGSIMGWLRAKANEPTVYIDFGIRNIRNKEFLEGFEPCVLLDFNVPDGVIFDKI